MSKPVKSAPLLPPDSGRDRPLLAVAAILVFLASLAGIGAAGAWQAAEGWTAQLTDQITVQVLPAQGRDADADAEAAAVEIARLPGVAAAEARGRAQSERLLEPWLGAGVLPDDLPVPRLIAVRLDPETPLATGAVEALLADAPYEVVVDDHDRWERAVRQAAAAVRYFGLAVVALLTLAAAAVVAFAARASLAARWDVAEALHLVGAPDSYVTRLFQERFFMLGVKAGLIGAVMAGLAGLGLAALGGGAGAIFFLPRFELNWISAAIPAGAALVSGVVAAVSARIAVANELKARWS
jgi:cell division transport system permease protein